MICYICQYTLFKNQNNHKNFTTVKLAKFYTNESEIDSEGSLIKYNCFLHYSHAKAFTFL